MTDAELPDAKRTKIDPPDIEGSGSSSSDSSSSSSSDDDGSGTSSNFVDMLFLNSRYVTSDVFPSQFARWICRRGLNLMLGAQASRQVGR